MEENLIHKDMYYQYHTILSYTIKYPRFVSSEFEIILDRINSYYRNRAITYEGKDILELFQRAKEQFEYSVTNKFPIRPFEAYVDYKVTYNQDCGISLFYDKYEYTGGAHGITIRKSDTWDIEKSKKLNLSDLFPKKSKYRNCIIYNINKQIEQSMCNERYGFFNNYEELVEKNFNEKNFYLTPKGIVIYFQQYDIAPYASGHPTFLITYGICGAEAIECK